jgi:hypothetical protein
LESCTNDRRDKVTQFQDPTYIDATAATSADAEVNPSDKPRFDDETLDDSYSMHANYATMMNDDIKKLLITIF